MEAVSFLTISVPENVMLFLADAGERTVAMLQFESMDTTRSGASPGVAKTPETQIIW